MTGEVSSINFPSLPELGPLAENLATLDNTRIALFDSTARYVRLPTGRNLNNLSAATDGMIFAFYASVQTIAQGEDNIAIKSQMLATMLLNEDQRRVNFLHEITGDQSFLANEMGHTSLASFLQYDLEGGVVQDQVPTSVQSVMDCFMESLSIDFAQMAEHVQQTTAAKILGFGKKIGHHTITAALAGASTAAMYYFLQKKRRP